MRTNESIDSNSQYLRVSVVRSLTPNYRFAADNGLLKALPYSLSIDRSSKQTFTVKEVWPPTGEVSYTNWTSDYMDDYTTSFRVLSGRVQADIDSYNAKRDNRLLAKLKGQSLPLIMAWRERNETGRLVLSAMQKISDAVKFIRHPKQFVRKLWGSNRYGSIKKAERRAQKAYINFLKYRRWPKGRNPRVGDLFLQYEFAWRPLIMDIQDALDATSNIEKRMRGGQVKVGYKYENKMLGTGGRSSDTDLILQCKYSIYGHQCITWSVDEIALASLSQIQGLPETLYDAIPYSFVVDWFVNIGEYLSLVNATLGLKFNYGYKSLCIEKSYTSWPGPPRNINGSIYSTVTNWPERYQFSFSRQILSSFPTPTIVSNLEKVTSALHIAEAAALLEQLFHRKL